MSGKILDSIYSKLCTRAEETGDDYIESRASSMKSSVDGAILILHVLCKILISKWSVDT